MKEFLISDFNLEDKKIIARLDLTKKIVYCNKFFSELIDYDKGEIINNIDFFDLLKAAMPYDYVEEILFNIDKNKNWAGFVRIQRKNSEERIWGFLNVSPLIDNLEGNIKSGYTVMISNVTKNDIEEMKLKFRK